MSNATGPTEGEPAKISAPSLSDRVTQYQQEVEKVVTDVGEHPLYELKRSCSLNQLADKIEFIKDVQSICTSKIEAEKYLVIGADASARAFINLDNADEFDDARLRQQFGRYLEPIPLFEVFILKASDGKNFALLVFPKQKTRRIFAKATIEDSSSPKHKLLLREG